MIWAEVRTATSRTPGLIAGRYSKRHKATKRCRGCIRPAQLISALSVMVSAVPTDYRSLLPNTSQAHRRDSQGGGVSSEEPMQTTLPEKVEMLGWAFLFVLALVNCLR